MRLRWFAVLAAFAIVLPAGAACGIRFTVPKGWIVTETHPEPKICALGVNPANWEQLREKARWPVGDDAIDIQVLSVGFEEAVDNADWRIEDGEVTAFDRGGKIDVERVRYGGMSGYASSGWSRGYAKDGADLGDDSRLFTATNNVILLRRGPKSFVLISYEEGNPDVDIDLWATAQVILHSIRKQ
jgi:hypothetical protein